MKPFRIALCQVRAREIENPEPALQDILRLLDDAAEAGAQLVALPECSYPAYYLRDADPYARENVRNFHELCGLFADSARRHGFWLAVGVARPFGSGKLANSALVFGPDGEPRGHYDKSFLWHFDRNWFQRGTRFPVWETDFCKFGALICADGRQPEIARSLALNGAEVILDLTAWVSWGSDVEQLTTTQCEYLMPARAFENGVWVAAADKYGAEADSILYAGRSTVIDPSGTTRVCAASNDEALVTYDIEPMPASLVPRRPALYRTLVEPTRSLPVTRELRRPIVPARENHRVAVVPSVGELDVARMATAFREARSQGADLVVFGGADGPEGWQVALPDLEALVRETGGALVAGVTTTGCSVHQSVVLLTPEGTTEHVATHGRGIQLGDSLAPVVSTPLGNVGLLCGEEGLVPEVARSLMLRGADILAWPIFTDSAMTERFARTRSDENRVYTAAAWPLGGMVVAPNGAPMAIVPHGASIAMAAQVNKAMSRWKDMAPGTNVVNDRIPKAYGALLR